MSRAAWPDRALLAIAALALVLRLGLVALTPGFVPAYDAADYQRIATAISQTGGYPPTTYADPGTPSAFRPPAWPHALAATQVVAGSGWTAGRLLGALLGTASVILLFLAGREVCGRRTALLGAGLAAVFPPLVFADTALLSEALFVPSTLAMAWALLRARRAARPLPWIAGAGVLAGLAILTRSAGLVLLLPLAVAAWRAADGRRRAARHVAVAAAMVAVALAPWAIRNAAAFGAFVPLSTQGGATLAGTFNAEAAQPGPYEAANRLPTDVGELRALLERGGDEAEIDRRLRGAAREYLAEHPGYVLTVVVRNTQRLWASGGYQQRWLTRLSHEEMGVPERLDGLVGGSAALSFPLAVAGAVVLGRRRRRVRAGERRPGGPLWLWSIPLLLWLATVVVSGAPRYRVAIDPFMLLLGAVALRAAAGRLRAGLSRESPRPA